MSATKRYLEDLSVRLGYAGEINDVVIRAAQNDQSDSPYLNDCSGCGFPFMSEDDNDEYCNRCASLLDQGNPY